MHRLVAVVAAGCLIAACQGADGSSRRSSQRQAVVHRRHSSAPFDLTALVQELRRRGAPTRVLSDTPTASREPLDVAPVTVCARHTRLHVYEYDSRTVRKIHSRGIDESGSTIRAPSGSMAEVDWVGPPHFYARGRLIVLHLSTRPVAPLLRRVLGRPLTHPRWSGRGFDGDC